MRKNLLLFSFLFSSELVSAATVSDVKTALSNYCVPISDTQAGGGGRIYNSAVCASVFEAIYKPNKSSSIKCDCYGPGATSREQFLVYDSNVNSRKCRPKCSIGYEAINISSVGCPNGTYRDVIKRNSSSTSTIILNCEACKAGQYNTDGFVCLDCPAGKYASGTANTGCALCPAGTYSGAGAASCLSCSAGTYASGTGNATCSNCQAGTYSTIGSASCSACSAGTWAPEKSGSCTNCLSTGAATCDSKTGKVTSCLTGYELSNGACKTCSAGKYYSNGNCISCPGYGTSVSACNPTTGKATSCYPGYGLSSENCSQCQYGKFSAGGTSPCQQCTADQIIYKNASCGSNVSTTRRIYCQNYGSTYSTYNPQQVTTTTSITCNYSIYISLGSSGTLDAGSYRVVVAGGAGGKSGTSYWGAYACSGYSGGNGDVKVVTFSVPTGGASYSASIGYKGSNGSNGTQGGWGSGKKGGNGGRGGTSTFNVSGIVSVSAEGGYGGISDNYSNTAIIKKCKGGSTGSSVGSGENSGDGYITLYKDNH